VGLCILGFEVTEMCSEPYIYININVVVIKEIIISENENSWQIQISPIQLNL
jgi:hypothetical protein